MKKEDNNLKREYLRKKQLELLARGLEVYQTQLDNAVDIDDITDSVILEQINSLKTLRSKYPRLARDINDDLNVLLSQINPVDIKNYNKINFLIQNDIETEYINILYFLSIFENAQLTDKQKDLLINIVSGFSYEGNAKNFSFMCKKIQKSKERVNKMSKKQFTDEQLKKLFPAYFSNPQEYFNEYLNYSKKLSCYSESVAESKRKGDRIRALSLKYSILPLTLDEE